MVLLHTGVNAMLALLGMKWHVVHAWFKELWRVIVICKICTEAITAICENIRGTQLTFDLRNRGTKVSYTFPTFQNSKIKGAITENKCVMHRFG